MREGEGPRVSHVGTGRAVHHDRRRRRTCSRRNSWDAFSGAVTPPAGDLAPAAIFVHMARGESQLGELARTAVVTSYVAWAQGFTPLFPALKNITKAIHTCEKYKYRYVGTKQQNPLSLSQRSCPESFSINHEARPPINRGGKKPKYVPLRIREHTRGLIPFFQVEGIIENIQIQNNVGGHPCFLPFSSHDLREALS